jgi:hypothetical protein
LELVSLERVEQIMSNLQHTQTHQNLLDLLDQAFPGQLREVQTAKERFDSARLAQVRAVRQGDGKQAFTSLDDVDKARRALQQAILHLGISLIQYAVVGGHEERG